MRPFSLYIHIPFCFHKCPYCDFNTYAVSAIPEKEYVSGLLAELDYRAEQPEWRARIVQTVYFGGGTPSLFQSASIRKIISAICKTFPLDERAEISLEANPGTLTAESVAGYADAGVNRISLGAQSFERTTLKTLGRIHSPEQIEDAVEASRTAGIGNINIDIIYGVPEQSIESLREDLTKTLALNPSHVSAYGLTIEKGTPFHLAFKKGALKLPKEEILVTMMEEVNERLPKAGLTRYEISNFAQPGKEARHNMAYWNGTDYLGLGAGAHSFCTGATGSQGYGRRWSNFALPQKYITETTAHGTAESWADTLTRDSAIFEAIFLGLRTSTGIDLAAFKQRFGVSLHALYPNLLRVLSSERLIKSEPTRIALSSRGFMLADSVIENFAQPERDAAAVANQDVPESLSREVGEQSSSVAPLSANEK